MNALVVGVAIVLRTVVGAITALALAALAARTCLIGKQLPTGVERMCIINARIQLRIPMRRRRPTRQDTKTHQATDKTQETDKHRETNEDSHKLTKTINTKRQIPTNMPIIYICFET